MSKRCFSLLLLTVFVCAGMAHAQDIAPTDAPGAVADQQPVAEGLTGPVETDSPGPWDTTPVPGTEETPGLTPAPDPTIATDAMPAPDAVAGPPDAETPAQAAPPAVIEPGTGAPAAGSAPGSVAPVAQDDRIRSMFILVSAVVLITTLIAIIFILLKRSRDSRQEQRRYVAEAFLRDVSGSTSQGMYKLGLKPVMLGRVGGKDTEFLDYIVIPSATIGRRHALIEFKDFGYWVMDQGSINGTFVNDRPVSAEVRLKHGDRLRLHKLEFEFVMPELGESGVTVLAQDGGRAAAVAAAPAAAVAQSDFVLEPEPDAIPEADDGNLDELRESIESGEATLLPGSSSPARPAGGPDDETLLPASGGGEGGAEETLLPASGSSARGKEKSSRNGNDKNGDDVFDITGGG